MMSWTPEIQGKQRKTTLIFATGKNQGATCSRHAEQIKAFAEEGVRPYYTPCRTHGTRHVNQDNPDKSLA
jgi:hypothetical protein